MSAVSDTEAIPALPALKCLGRLSELRPTVIADTREQLVLPFYRLPVVRGTIRTGDYSFVGADELFTIERKSVPDLVSCCTASNRDRFENELHRARGYRFARLVIVGTREEIAQELYRSSLPGKVVLHTLSAFEARYIPVVFIPTPEEAALKIEEWIYWFARQMVEEANTLARDNGLTQPAANGG
ncbi:MAG: hypothetical protein U1E51_26320 [Candidatus Binatia bacterium]|nr:hypothetical protein [Candidatus Binatia bacterium]